MKVWLDREGYPANRKRVRRLMRTMGLQAIYRRPRTSKPALGHRVYPYLLGGMEITRPNQVWAAESPTSPWPWSYTTWWPSWTGTLGTWWPGTCPTPWTLISVSRPWKRRWAREGRRCSTLTKGASSPEPVHRSQFTGEAFTGLLERNRVRISMDGKGRYSDNIFVERLWRTVKYEEVYLKAHSNGREAKAGLDGYFHFYNNQRPHQALGYRTPAEVFNGDSVQSTEHPTGGRWSPNRALVNLGNTAGLSLNNAPILSH